ncbi:MAG TPA: ribosome biogenesis GTP-binding protein YihA/YsxC [Acidobacteriota bacterium]|nr:ribosome biogenesis GTP-binding protein YihA/YsxC [Acidobacteriota bacterium]
MEAQYVKSVYSPADLPRDRKTEIAIAGKSNVGKSSLLNRLAARHHLAKTSRTPGKTRCLNFFLFETGSGQPFYVVDLPGYGYARVSKKMRDDWSILIEAYLDSPERPAGVIALFDARREPTEEDREWLAWLANGRRPFLTVLTKCDKLSGNQRAQALRRWTVEGPDGPVAPLATSAVTGVGKDKIWSWIDNVRRTAGSRTASS